MRCSKSYYLCDLELVDLFENLRYRTGLIYQTDQTMYNKSFARHYIESASRILQLHNDFPVYLTAVACCAGLGNIAERKVCTDKRL